MCKNNENANHKVCEYCKENYPASEAYCPFCKKESWNYCSDCGKTIPKDETECKCQDTPPPAKKVIFTACGEVEERGETDPSIH